MEWKEVRLGDVCTKITDGSHFSPKAQTEGYPMLSVKDMREYDFDFSNCKKISYEDYLKMERDGCVPQIGDVLVAKDGSYLKEIFICKEQREIALLSSIAIFRPNSQLIDSRFLCYCLKSPRVYNYISLNCVSGSALPRIILKDFKGVNIKVPSLDDQRRIASILSSLDRKIELNNKINADLEEMAQAIFKNWFVDFEPFKDGKFVDSELGMIPEGWKVGRLTDVIKLMPGGTPKTSEPLYWDNGTIPFFSPKDVNGVYCFATEKHITEAGLNKCSSNLYPKDTIFITCRGTVGKVCLVACDMAMNQSNYAIKAIDGYSQYYVFFLVKSVVERLIKKSNGAVFSAITSKDFDEEILIPSQNAVEDFTNVIDGFFRRIFTIGTETSRLSLLRDTLLPRLMSGELEVPE